MRSFSEHRIKPYVAFLTNVNIKCNVQKQLITKKPLTDAVELHRITVTEIIIKEFLNCLLKMFIGRFKACGISEMKARPKPC